MARKFSENLEIKLDNHQNSIKNKEQIINEINNIEDLSTIEDVKKYYFKFYETADNSVKKEMAEIANKLNERTEQIKSGEINLQESFDKAKEENSNLKNINMIKTNKEDNDKLNGMKRAVTYLQINVNGKNELYEVTNEKAINAFLNNSELIKNMSESQIIEKLQEHSMKRDTTTIDTRSNSSLNSDTIKNEISRIDDPYVRRAFEEVENLVLQERVEIKKYVDKEMPGATITYGLNSFGERIYMVEDKMLKFEGDDRTLKVLTKDEDSKSNVNNANFDRANKGGGNLGDIKISNFNTLEDFKDSVSYLNYIIESISLDMGVTNSQIDFLTAFIEKCVEREEMIVDQHNRIEASKQTENPINEIPLHIPGELESIYELYVSLAKESPKFTNPRMKEILDRKQTLDALKPKEMKQDKALDNEYIKKLTKENKNDKLTTLEKAGFISVAIILEASVIIGGIIAILAVVKK